MKLGVSLARTAFTNGRNKESLQLIEQARLCSRTRNQFNQVHVTWWIEKVDAAETMAQIFGESLCQFIDRKPRGIGGEDGVRIHKRRDLTVQV